MKFWFRQAKEKSPAEFPYHVTCACGHPLVGLRQASFQVVRCPRCGSDRFVLPRSPLPTPFNTGESAALPRARLSPNKLWLLPAIAMVSALVVLVVFFRFFLTSGNQPPSEKSPSVRSAEERLQLAGKHLGQGGFRLAAAAVEGSAPEELSPVQRRRWRQLRREASILADLLNEPVEDIVRHAAGVAEQEWLADFPSRYQGKSLVFDVRTQRLANGSVRADYHFFLGQDNVRLEFGDLELLKKSPLDQPRRLVFAARLAGVRLEPPGPSWVVRFQPDSGVWLTEPRAAALCCPPLGEPDAVELLEQQAKWAEGP